MACCCVMNEHDAHTDSDLRSSIRDLTNPRSSTVGSFEGVASEMGHLGRGAIGASTNTAPHVLSSSNRTDILENLRNAIAIIENLQEENPERTPIRTEGTSVEEVPSVSDDVTSAEAVGSMPAPLPVRNEEAPCQISDGSEEMLLQGKTPVAALNDTLQRLNRAVPGTQIMEWVVESTVVGRFVATVIFNLPGGSKKQACSPKPESSKIAAKNSAAVAALPLLRELVEQVSQQRHLAGSSVEAAAGGTLQELHEKFQSYHNTNPKWEEQSDPDDPHRFRYVINLPNDQAAQGSWAHGKQEAKRSAIKCALELHLATSTNHMAEPAVTVAAEAGSAAAGSMGARSAEGPTVAGQVSLSEMFTKKYKASPKWEEESDPNDQRRFRFTIQLPNGQAVQGDWDVGKQQAKHSALERALESDL